MKDSTFFAQVRFFVAWVPRSLSTLLWEQIELSRKHVDASSTVEEPDAMTFRTFLEWRFLPDKRGNRA
uniref:Sulfotransferase family protein n=1 Tax=Steinernema glaseri TaxID=37863 RepID=A0A1I7YHW1_9BILA